MSGILRAFRFRKNCAFFDKRSSVIGLSDLLKKRPLIHWTSYRGLTKQGSEFKKRHSYPSVIEQHPSKKEGKEKFLPTSTSRDSTFSIRFATSSDIPSILRLFSDYPDENLHPRSPDFFRKMTERDFAIVMESEDTKRIVAYIELCFFFTKKDRDSFFMDPLKLDKSHLIPFIPGDILVYMGGALRDPSCNFTASWGAKAMRFIVDFFETKSTLSETPKEQRRIVIGYGKMQRTLPTWLDNILRELVQTRKMTRLRVTQHPMPHDSHRVGFLMFQIYDKPLTSHQLDRTTRNRYLITEAEQQQLLGCRIGIVGLSTGSVALEALLRQGIGGVYRIADFDDFEVSNGNRMIFDKGDAGRSKLELCTERIFSCDPDIIVEPFPTGISKDNVNDFVQDCDIIIEECDDFLVKYLVRVEAMKYRKPLIMATSQNGMIDIERYDIDHEIKPFHAKNLEEISQLMASSKVLSAEEKAKMLSKLFNINLFSSRFMESSKEIGKSISSWPQLAEEVFLGAATLTHITRRILLGDTEIVSGRFSCDMNSMFTKENRISTTTPPSTEAKQQGEVKY